MADVDLQGNDARNRSLAVGDLLVGASPGENDAADAWKADTITEVIALFMRNPDTTLTAAQRTAFRAALSSAAAADLVALTARVAALEQGAPPPTTHTRYALLRTAAGTPSADDFEMSTISGTSQIIQIPAFTDASYIWFAEIYDELDFIGEQGGSNARRAFSANPTNLGDINGVTYYAYGSLVAFDANPAAVDWELVRTL